MKKFSQAAAAVSLGLACAMPVLAQDSSTSTTTTQEPVQSTQTMGAGPENMNTAGDRDNDLGWLGLLGLAGLLGLRRKHHDDRHDMRTAHR